MRTATVKIDSRLFFSYLGLQGFYGKIDDYSIEDEIITLKISGEDSRIPNGENYPDCFLVSTRVESHLEKT